MKLQQAIGHLSRTGWFAAQNETFQRVFSTHCQLRFLKAGERLTSLGDPPGGLYGLASGALNVYVASGPFPPFLAFIAYPGWWMGEAAAATRTPKRVEQVARVDSHVLFVSGTSLAQIAAGDKGIWHILEEITVGHMDNALFLASILAGTDKRMKVLATLARLAMQFDPKVKSIELDLTQSELAEMVGLTRNSIGPVLSALAKENVIKLRYGGLVVHRKLLEKAVDT